MKASELLAQLQVLIKEHGDCKLAAVNDDLCIQGVFLQTGYTPHRIELSTVMSEYCCLHCGFACAKEFQTGEDCYGETGEYHWPEACPGCGKNPQE